MIPKIIHFVWVGDQPKSSLVLKCIASWKKYLPDYKIIEWNDEAFLKLSNQYARQAYENRKWAFVSDYLRLYALKKYGGFYFDSDLEITADISQFRNLDFVSGYELYKEKAFPITALMGAVAGQRIISDLYEFYEDASFISTDGLDMTTNTARISGYFEKTFGLKGPYDGEVLTEFGPAEKIYPYGFFCTPSNHHENYAIHHFGGSWVDGYIRKKIFSVGRFSFIKFKKVSSVDTKPLPLLADENLIFKFSRNQMRVYGFVFSLKTK